MLPVFILEDDPRQRTVLDAIINNYILIEDLDMKLILSTDKPQDVLDHLEKDDKKPGLYFLDVELNDDMDGITLGKKIRKLDPSGSIVFITSHGDLAMTIFKHKIEALDYIVKDRDLDALKVRIIECIQAFQMLQTSLNKGQSPQSQRFFKVHVGKKTHLISFDETMFFQNSDTPNRIDLHLENRRIQFRGTLKEILTIAPTFIQVHRSVVVNRLKIKAIDLEKSELEMINGARCIYSTRGLRELKKAMSIEAYNKI
jgi:two-component system response regulator AgrA